MVFDSQLILYIEQPHYLPLLIQCFDNRYVAQMKYFPRGRSALSEIFNYMVEHISEEKGYVLKNFNQPFLSQVQMDLFCNRISGKGSPYKRCFGFVDGTVRAICRPTTDQREVYQETNV